MLLKNRLILIVLFVWTLWLLACTPTDYVEESVPETAVPTSTEDAGLARIQPEDTVEPTLEPTAEPDENVPVSHRFDYSRWYEVAAAQFPDLNVNDLANAAVSIEQLAQEQNVAIETIINAIVEREKRGMHDDLAWWLEQIMELSADEAEEQAKGIYEEIDEKLDELVWAFVGRSPADLATITLQEASALWESWSKGDLHRYESESWGNRHIYRYEYEYRRMCETCPDITWGKDLRDRYSEGFGSHFHLLERVESHLKPETDRLHVTYHPTFGFPVTYDYLLSNHDVTLHQRTHEESYQLSYFRVTPLRVDHRYDTAQWDQVWDEMKLFDVDAEEATEILLNINKKRLGDSAMAETLWAPQEEAVRQLIRRYVNQKLPGGENLTVTREEASALWQSWGVDNYEYTEKRLCFGCGRYGHHVIAVRGEQVVDVTHIPEETGDKVRTIDESDEMYATLFDRIAQIELEEYSFALRATYDPLFGIPTSYYVDHSLNYIDDEVMYTFSDFVFHRK